MKRPSVTFSLSVLRGTRSTQPMCLRGIAGISFHIRGWRQRPDELSGKPLPCPTRLSVPPVFTDPHWAAQPLLPSWTFLSFLGPSDASGA